MFPEEVYRICKILGLNKEDVENVVVDKSTGRDNVEFTSSVDVYKSEGRYGTISIRDFQ